MSTFTRLATHVRAEHERALSGLSEQVERDTALLQDPDAAAEEAAAALYMLLAWHLPGVTSVRWARDTHTNGKDGTGGIG